MMHIRKAPVRRRESVYPSSEDNMEIYLDKTPKRLSFLLLILFCITIVFLPLKKAINNGVMKLSIPAETNNIKIGILAILRLSLLIPYIPIAQTRNNAGSSTTPCGSNAIMIDDIGIPEVFSIVTAKPITIP